MFGEAYECSHNECAKTVFSEFCYFGVLTEFCYFAVLTEFCYFGVLTLHVERQCIQNISRKPGQFSGKRQ